MYTLLLLVKDSVTRRARDSKDAILHPKLDTLVTDASKTDRKVNCLAYQLMPVFTISVGQSYEGSVIRNILQGRIWRGIIQED